jgi:hypothetical protein
MDPDASFKIRAFKGDLVQACRMETRLTPLALKLGLSPFGPGVPGLPQEALASRLPQTRPRDPLGLGNLSRPPPPPDPDKHDPGLEDREYSRSLMSAEERETIGGYLSIDEVRSLIADNQTKAGGEVSIEPWLLLFLDARIDYKVFIVDDNAFTREELYDNYAFHEMKMQPEAVFARQEIGVFPPKGHALGPELEYEARDSDDLSIGEVFLSVEDLVARASRANHKDKRPAHKVVKTKFYIGKELWRDFLHLQRTMRAMFRLQAVHAAYNLLPPSPSDAAEPATPSAAPQPDGAADAQQEIIDSDLYKRMGGLGPKAKAASEQSAAGADDDSVPL